VAAGRHLPLLSAFALCAMRTLVLAPVGRAAEVGLGRIVALYYYSSNFHRNR
jgi:hypothetical protein